MIPLLLTFLDANIWMISMNASEKVSGFRLAAEKTGMQFGTASMDTLMRMRAGPFRSGVSTRCQMNYRNTVNQCGISFPICRRNSETFLCVMNHKSKFAQKASGGAFVLPDAFLLVSTPLWRNSAGGNKRCAGRCPGRRLPGRWRFSARKRASHAAGG